MAYEPKETEKKWQGAWDELSIADPHSDKTPYCIVIPPPNVTGSLHMGHALVDTLQDILIRWKRMSGYETLWVPGTDHAGIATQTVVERHLMKKTGKRRVEHDRETFVQEIWNWKEKYEGNILAQLKALGCSCDWSRLRFTMDEGCHNAVNTIFKRMFDDGLIYQGDYLVNWDTVTETALADDEVEYEEQETYLWHFKYPVESGETLIVATTRPETMLGDTAVAVSPDDKRYAAFVGKNILLPLSNRKIPIITDHHVDPEFGTGVVKITPAHDPNDYEMGLRHSLPMINIMTPDGHINEHGGEFEGLKMKEAREAVVQKMDALGLLEKKVPHVNRVGISYRSKAVIEPFLSKQWFVKMESFKPKLIAAVKEGKVKLIPKNWENTYFHWIENLRDWCISRQLWWGHRIPIWYNKHDPKQITSTRPEHLDDWEQDPDVLDTWFSSALWPYSALGFPEKTPELAKFYPNSTLVTGHDILFFWVARMLVMGEYAMGELPFPETFLHGLIYGKSYWREEAGYVSKEEKDKFDQGEKLPKDVLSKWEKMSKSKGNVIDPIEMIDQYGTDAVRFTLTAIATHARQIDLDVRRFEEYKNFMNKLYNGAKFVMMHLPETLSGNLDNLRIEDEWIIARLHETITSVEQSLTTYSFDQVAHYLYDFYWNDFCAYYVELVKKDKTETGSQILCIALTATLRLLHPICPFITEELFSEIKDHFKGKDHTPSHPLLQETAQALTHSLIAGSPFPKSLDASYLRSDAIEGFKEMQELVYAVRNIRAEMGLPPNTPIDLYVSAPLSPDAERILKSLVKISEIKEGAPTSPSSEAVLGQRKLMIPFPPELLEKEKKRQAKEREKLEKSIAGFKARLSNPSFTEKAPPHLVEQTQNLLKEAETKLSSLIQE